MRTTDEFFAATRLHPALPRFPGDCYDASDLALAHQLGFSVISGDVRSGDAFNNSAAMVTAIVLRNLRPGSIVLLHIHGGPNAPMTAPALRSIIEGVRLRGLGFGTVSEVLGRLLSPEAPAARSARELLQPFRELKVDRPQHGDRVLAPFRLRRLTLPAWPYRRLLGQPVQ